ncbi:venom serine protease-like [Zophobas morio]|uniref:venom serine protease-like n=1 Tax=Zophobas morio TaxID=2755281 RepID=UPI003082B60A
MLLILDVATSLLFDVELASLVLLKWFVVFAVATERNCIYYQDVVPEQTYYIYNNEYPNFYRPSTSCQWNVRSPPDTVVVLNCEIDIPATQHCQTDRLSISTTGDQDFSNSRSYCGNNSFSTISERNFLTVGLFSGNTSTGGKFVCSVEAMRVAPRWCFCSYQEEETKFVKGEETGVNEFPWMAAIVDVSIHNVFCGASLISVHYALTSAYCLRGQVPTNVALLVGDHDVSTGSDTSAAALYRISDFFQHPGYNIMDESNNIAVLKTSTPIRFSSKVGPVCLPFRYGRRNFVNDTVTVLGWGFKDFAGHKSDTLHKVNLTVVSNSYCAQNLEQHIHPTQMCTYTLGEDSCATDSGGPLLWRNSSSGRFQLVGLVSSPLTCATNAPAVNTRVTSFLSWIVSVTNDTIYCVN